MNNFRRLLNPECGQRNPIELLVGHTTRDLAHQETVRQQSQLRRTEYDQMAPQTFRTDDLYREMNLHEQVRTARPNMTNQLSGTSRLDQYQQREMTSGFGSGIRNQQQFDSRWSNQQMSYHNQPQHQQPRNDRTYLTEYHSEFADHHQYRHRQQEMTPEYGWAIQNQQQYDRRLPNQQTFYHNHLQQKQPKNERTYLAQHQNKVEDPQEEYCYTSFTSFDDLEEMMNTCEDEPEPEVEKKNNPKAFNDYMNEYIRKYTAWGKKYSQISKAELLTSGYPFSKNNPMMRLSNPKERGLSYVQEGKFSNSLLCFEAAVQKEPKSSENRQLLCESLHRVEDTHKVLCATKQQLKPNPSDCWLNFSMANAYYLNNRLYQTCYHLVNWLRYNEDYYGVIPSDFKMKELDSMQSPELDNGRLQSIIQIFLNAAQNNPDKYMHHALAVLYRLSGEYDRAVECQRLVGSNVYDHRIGNEKFDLGMYLFLGGKPEEAIKIFEGIANTKDQAAQVNACIKIGFTHMYSNDYKNALISFKKAQELSSEDDIEYVAAWLSACQNLLGSGQKIQL